MMNPMEEMEECLQDPMAMEEDQEDPMAEMVAMVAMAEMVAMATDKMPEIIPITTS